MVVKNDFSEYPKYEELFDDLKNYYNQLLDEITYVNKDAYYNDVKEYFSILNNCFIMFMAYIYLRIIP